MKLYRTMSRREGDLIFERSDRAYEAALKNKDSLPIRGGPEMKKELVINKQLNSYRYVEHGVVISEGLLHPGMTLKVPEGYTVATEEAKAAPTCTIYLDGKWYDNGR